jgi:SSS family solute:Na+ symporter
MTPTAAWVGLVAGTVSAVAVDRLAAAGVIDLPGQGAAFLAASTAFVVDLVLSIVVSLVTKPKPASELKGLVYSETPREDRIDPEESSYPWYRRTVPLAGIALVMVIVLNAAF